MPTRFELGPDVVEQHARDPLRCDLGEDHRHQPAQRSSEEYRLFDPELVEQLEHVHGIGRRLVARGLRVPLAHAAPAEIDRDHAPVARIARGDGLEVAGVAGKPGSISNGGRPAGPA